MTVAELKNMLLLKGGLSPKAVSFEPGVLTAAEQYRIEPSNGFWEVYYFERGNKNALKLFPDEDSACEDLLKRLLADKTVWIHRPREI